MLRSSLIVLPSAALVVAMACASAELPSSPTSSASTASPTLSGPLSLSGRVVDRQYRSPVVDARLVLRGDGFSTAQTDGQGRFQFSSLPVDTFVMNIISAGFLDRELRVSLSGSRSDFEPDMISLAPPFDLAFYREFARGALDFGPGRMRSINPWTVAPSFYLNSSIDNGSQRVPDNVIADVIRVIVAGVPELTGGKFSVAAVETGTIERPARDGWVNVSFVSLLGSFFGTATVGGNIGTMTLKYDPYYGPAYRHCLDQVVNVAQHEITHSMGYFHTGGNDFDTADEGCPGVGRPARVAYHARVMYSRPPGNKDPDADPSSAFHVLAQKQGMPEQIACRIGGR